MIKDTISNSVLSDKSIICRMLKKHPAYFIMLRFYFLCLALLPQNVDAQRNAVWCFGDSAGIDFNTSSPSTFISQAKSRGSCTTMSDTAGNLLFYAFTRATMAGNTALVFNRNH